jgi:hypothetical protein
VGLLTLVSLLDVVFKGNAKPRLAGGEGDAGLPFEVQAQAAGAGVLCHCATGPVLGCREWLVAY